MDLIDAETLRSSGGFEAFAGRSALAIEYSPDGRRLAVAGTGGGVGLWDAGSGKRVGPLLRAPRGPNLKNPHDVQALAFGQGGLLAAGDAEGAVWIWSLDGRKLIRRLPPVSKAARGWGGVRGLAFSPDGSQLAIPFAARFWQQEPDGVDVRDPRSGDRLVRLRTDRSVSSVAFSPDGGLLAGGQDNGSTFVWATDGWARVGRPLSLGRGERETLGVAFSPDGRTLASSHNDGTVVLWDVGSQAPIGSPLPGLPNTRVTADFTPDGDRLFAVSDAGEAIRWEVDPEVWAQHACDVAGELTPEQWDEVVPEQDYVSVCPPG